MHEGSLRSLEFDRIVEVVQSFALTPLGAARLAELRPRTDIRSAQAALAATSECVRYLESNGPVGLDAPADLEQALTSLAIEGLPLEAGHLRGLAAFLSSVDAVRRAVASADGGPFPALQTTLEGCRSFAGEISQIRAKIDDAGNVVDDASDALRTIRGQLRRQTNRLRSTLDSYLRGKGTARYLQERIVTERAGRHVLVIKAEHRDAIPGIVHGSSGSGASLFLEPLSTVEINNDIVALADREAAEVQRILLELTNALRKRALDLRHILTAATEVDEIQARATFSRLVGGAAPALSAELHLEFRDARHPLLIPEVRARLRADDAAAGQPTPVDVCAIPPTSVLVITGPNAGGKTVALKTAGLLALMAQAGLHVPAAPGSRVTVFRTVFADIGDEQSITASVSTFSGHISNIVSMHEHLKLPALVLLDEVGAGTDPLEGGALGAALIEHFRARGAVVMATTHDELLKAYAATTAGVACAAFGFDTDTFAPNYHLTYGAPGRSLAFEIAARLGVPPGVIQAARDRRSAREAQLAEQLTRVDDELRSLEGKRQELARERERLTSERADLDAARQQVEARAEGTRLRLADGVGDRIRAARKEIDAVVDDLRRRVSDLQRTAAERAAAGKRPLTTGETGALRSAGHAALDTLASRKDAVAAAQVPPSAGPAAGSSPLAGAPEVGATVKVESLGLDGRVRALHATDAEVEVRGKRLRVPLSGLRAAPGGERPQSGRVTVHAVDEGDLPPDLNVIGRTVDEALSLTERHLDRAVLHELREVRVIHGHGTGALRRSIAGFLQTHPQVARFAPAPREQGGEGVTVVELKD